MGTQNSHFAFVLGEWIFAAAVVLATVIITALTRTILKSLQKENHLPILRRLAPTISNILYIIGFKIAADLAPVHGKIETWVNGAIYVLGISIFLNLIRQAALIGLEWSSLKTNNSETLRQGFIPLLRNLITLFIFFSGCIMVLKHFDYDVMSLITALGVGSLAVGLAAKDTLSNMISGFILIIDRNLRPGDKINLAGTVGEVREIGLRSTQILITDGNTLIVPNSELVNTRILNLSLPTDATTCSTCIRVPYSIPFNQIKSICLSVLNQLSYLSPGKPKWVNLISLADGHQLIQVGFWISDLNDSSLILSDFHERLLEDFEKAGVSLLGPALTLPSSAPR